MPGLGLTWMICTSRGLFPDPSGSYSTDAPFLGQVVAYAGSQPPPGWSPCDGAVLKGADNPALFAVLGGAWGGDGKTSFALPDLRGRVMLGG